MFGVAHQAIRHTSSSSTSRLSHPTIIMSYKFEGWLGHGPDSADGNMEWGSFEPKKWEEDDVDMQITHCGICATDIHTLRSDWGAVAYRESPSSIHIKFLYS